jgi:CRP/FNR family cyclic AMP-dependent transcriptional regulator
MSEEMSSLYLKKQSIFEGLNETQLNRVYAISKLHNLKKNTRIVINNFQSNRVYLIVKGKMKIANSVKNDIQSVKDIMYPGEMFGNISLNGFLGEEYAEALVNNTIIYCFGVNEFKALLENNHRLALNYAGLISTKLNSLKERYEIWTRYDTRTKLIYLLQKWALVEGEDAGQSIILNNYLSLTDIADILSVSRQFMHTLLKEMSSSGMIKYGRTQIEMSKSLLKDIYSY